MLITIASLDAKEKLTFVTTTENRKLRVWNDKAGRLGLEQGGTYEVETEATDYGTHITKAKRVAAPPAAANHGASAPAAAGAPFRTPEQMFVQGLLEAYIRAGKCANPGDLKAAGHAILDAYRDIWPPEEVADHYKVAAE